MYECIIYCIFYYSQDKVASSASPHISDKKPSAMPMTEMFHQKSIAVFGIPSGSSQTEIFQWLQKTLGINNIEQSEVESVLYPVSCRDILIKGPEEQCAVFTFANSECKYDYILVSPL